MRIVEINAPEDLRLGDHDSSSVGFIQPVLFRIAGEALNDELDRARVASVRHAIPYLNVLTRLVGQRHESVQLPTDAARLSARRNQSAGDGARPDDSSACDFGIRVVLTAFVLISGRGTGIAIAAASGSSSSSGAAW